MTDNIPIKINGKSVEVKRDSYLLDALKKEQIRIPTLCSHKDLSPSGTCRLCTVEILVKGKKKLVTACNYPVRDEIEVLTGSERVIQYRKMLVEMYLGRWPNVQVIKELAAVVGVSKSRFTSDITDTNEQACILCGKCVRACREFAQERIIDFAGQGINRHISMPFNTVDPHCIGCTSCAFVCPTGAIQMVDDLNHPLDPKMIRDHGMKINAEMARLDKDQCRMREVGTANIVDVMNDYDLLPVHNYMYGSDERTALIDSKMLKAKYFTQGQPDGCWKGCSMACAKTIDNFLLKTGPYKGTKVCVDGPEYETAAGAANMGCFDADFVAEFNFYCDTYGIDTISAATTIAFVMESFEAGEINTDHTGGLELNFGATDAVLELLHQMSRGEGFGVDVGQGIRWLKKKWVKEYGSDEKFLNDIGMESKGLEASEYVTKESLAQQCGYGMAIKGPQHDEAWLIFMDMVNNELPTSEDKAEALHYFPLWRTWFGLFGLCKLCWNDVVPADNALTDEPQKVPGHVNNYFKFVEGMTGIKMDEQKMLEQSGRVYNLQRVMCRMLGLGTRKDDYMPYRALGPVTVVEYESRADRYDKQMKEDIGVDPEGKTTKEKVKILRKYREEQYEKTVSVVYQRRGWTSNGVPKIERLKELGIDLPELVSIVKEDQE